MRANGTTAGNSVVDGTTDSDSDDSALDDERWQYETPTAEGVAELDTPRGVAGARVDAPGSVETDIVTADATIPVTVAAGEADETIHATAALSATQAEAFARALIEQAAAARERDQR